MACEGACPALRHDGRRQRRTRNGASVLTFIQTRLRLRLRLQRRPPPTCRPPWTSPPSTATRSWRRTAPVWPPTRSHGNRRATTSRSRWPSAPPHTLSSRPSGSSAPKSLWISSAACGRTRPQQLPARRTWRASWPAQNRWTSAPWAARRLRRPDAPSSAPRPPAPRSTEMPPCKCLFPPKMSLLCADFASLKSEARGAVLLACLSPR